MPFGSFSVVKADVYPPKLLTLPTGVKPINQNPTIINKVDTTQLQEKSMIGHIYGLGTLNNPIDLINKKAYTENGIFIECTTSCATSVKGIYWKAKNSVSFHDYCYYLYYYIAIHVELLNYFRFVFYGGNCLRV